MPADLSIDTRLLTFAAPIPGDTVTIADGITGIVTAVCVRDEQSVMIEVTWWDGRERKTAWFSPYEVNASRPNGQIGFVACA